MTVLLFSTIFLLVIQFACNAVKQNFTDDSTFCSLQNSIENVNDYSQLIEDSQSPYHLYIIDKGEQDGDGKTIYTVVLNGTTYFKRFLIQPKVTTNDGFILDNVVQTGNFFTETSEWNNQSVKLLQCPGNTDNSAIQSNDLNKFSINLKWTIKWTEFKIQFVCSVQQELHSHWLHFSSKISSIFPIETATAITRSLDHKKSEPSYSIFDKANRANKDKSDKITNGASSTNDTIEDYCKFAPCSANGLCVSFVKDYTYDCYCTDKWLGDVCTVENYCLSSPCKNQGICIYEDNGFSCQCRNGWVGTLCETSCPLTFCKNGGTCALNKSLNFACSCTPGWTGDTCETAIQPCDSFPCINGGTCQEKPNGYECLCSIGYMGDRCHRPCQNVLNGCSVYSEQYDCNHPNDTTSEFYKNNCAASCGLCKFHKSSIITKTPMPSALEPLENLLGTWYTGVSVPAMRFPLDFINNVNGFYEKLEISHPTVSASDGAFLTFRSSTVNRDNVGDEVSYSGFMFFSAKESFNRIALTTVGNDGLLLIEEGIMKGKREVLLTSKYFHAHPTVISKLSPKMKRKFTWNDIRLEMSIEKISISGKRESASLIYRKLRYD